MSCPSFGTGRTSGSTGGTSTAGRGPRAARSEARRWLGPRQASRREAGESAGSSAAWTEPVAEHSPSASRHSLRPSGRSWSTLASQLVPGWTGTTLRPGFVTSSRSSSPGTWTPRGPWPSARRPRSSWPRSRSRDPGSLPPRQRRLRSCPGPAPSPTSGMLGAPGVATAAEPRPPSWAARVGTARR